MAIHQQDELLQSVLLGRLMCADLLCSLVQVYHSPGLFVERQLRHAKKYKAAESPLLTPRSAHSVAALQHLQRDEAGDSCQCMSQPAAVILCTASEGFGPPVHIYIA